MKRNQMLRTIANTIYNNSYRSSMLETLPLAEKVLQEIEKAGMSPPVTMLYKNEYYPHGFYSHEWDKDDGAVDPLDPTVWEDNRGNK